MRRKQSLHAKGETIGRTLIVEADQAGRRLDVYIAAQLGVSRARAQRVLTTATVGGVPVKSSYLTRVGDAVALDDADLARRADASVDEAPFIEAGAALPPILYEDDQLMVLNKPRGLAVHPGAGERHSTLVDLLRAAAYPLSNVGPVERAGIVHRLDKETTGLILVCKTDTAHWKLAADFAERRVTKTYSALVCGVPPLRGRIEAPIARHPVNRKKMAVVPSGRPAITEYAVVRNWPKFGLLDVNLLTGRTHQIRVHLAYIHHPVAGDEVYGGRQPALDAAPNSAVREALEHLGGQALHAARLAFKHPATGQPMEFEAPLPEDMQHVIEAL